MSRTQPTQQANPASKFIQFSGETGKWTYYDKNSESKIEIETPCYFVILDELTTIKGYSDKYKSGIYSNEVHNSNEKLYVKSFKGDLAITGYYPDIKGEIKMAGGRYCKSVYAMLVDGENYELVNFQMYGVAFSAFLEHKFKYSQVVCITGENTKGQKGKTEYFIPEFKAFKIKDEISHAADEMDKELQAYFKSKKAQDVKEKVEDDEVWDKRNEIVEKHEEQLNQQADSYEDESDELPW